MSERPIRILFIEDDLVDRMAFERFLKSRPLPYVCTIADSARSAREHLNSEHYDLVISDYSLGDGTCLELLGEYKEPPFIVVTGTGSEETAVEAMKLGARDYLIKDAEACYLTVLPSTVKNVLARCEAEAELKRHREHLEELVRKRTAELVGEIQERLRAEREKRILEEQLHQAQKMEAVGQLASGIAHDFNNLLTVILGSIELMGHEFADGTTIEQTVETIRQAAQQAAGVTRALLTFSRKVPSEKTRVNLCDTLEKTVGMLGHVLPVSIKLAVEKGCHAPLWINADPTQIQQVIMNLAINARDAMPQGGEIRIAVRPAAREEAGEAATQGNDSFALLSVCDTGIGMTPEVQARIFEPFFTTKPRGQGTGLGLSILHSIVKDHGGSIAVQSEPGRGSMFSVFLPQLPAVTEQPAPAHHVGARCGQGELILLADDDQAILRIVTSMLEAHGYAVVHACSGDDLLDCWRKRRGELRLIVADVEMPGQSGLECLHTIRASGDAIPMIITTGAPEAGLEDQLCGEARLLRKPFRLDDLARLATDLVATDRGACR